jgi:GrpB-like predicted nucleotidyltransferase (UPF0157 family)
MSEYKTANTEYSIEEYDPAWKEKFKVLRNLIASVFGSKATAIEHVGSTSIEGMKAKPVIDVLVIVSDAADLKGEREKMENLGYMYKENYLAPSSLFLCRDEDGKRLENIHIFPQGHPKIAEFIDKRDYLRTHPEEVRRYEHLKEQLAKQFPDDYLSYRKAKGEYLNQELAEKVKIWKDNQN